MIIHQYRIYRQDLQNNPNVLYVFGDNLLEIGSGGQAGEMRGEPNAVGVPTKKRPGMNEKDFFTDDELAENIFEISMKVNRLTKHLKAGGVVVLPSDGIGTGLSQMPERCPKTFKYLCEIGLGGKS